MNLPSMQTLRPAVKLGIVLGGLVIALAVAWTAMEIRQRLNADDPAQGMQAFGDMVVGFVVFTVLALAPLGLALFWLRPVPQFWTILTSGAATYTLTGPVAVLVSGPLRSVLGNWALFGAIRVSTMPLSALALATSALFAPAVRQRWILLGAAFLDGVIFVGVVLFRFILPARH